MVLPVRTELLTLWTHPSLLVITDFSTETKKKLRMRKKKKLRTFLRSESVGLSLSQLYLLDLGIDNGDLIFVFPSFFLLYVCLMSFVCLDLLRKVCPCSAKVAR